jgi:hypothetical protein
MKSVSKQSKVAGGVVTRELHLGVDGPLLINLRDNIILQDENDHLVTVSSQTIMRLFQECQYKQLFAEMLQKITHLEEQIAMIRSEAHSQTITNELAVSQVSHFIQSNPIDPASSIPIDPASSIPTDNAVSIHTDTAVFNLTDVAVSIPTDTAVFNSADAALQGVNPVNKVVAELVKPK